MIDHESEEKNVSLIEKQSRQKFDRLYVYSLQNTFGVSSFMNILGNTGLWFDIRSKIDSRHSPVHVAISAVSKRFNVNIAGEAFPISEKLTP